jgi:chromosome segregation ATPase
MAQGSGKSGKEIERLLEERQRVEQWLEKLSQAAEKVPSHVRQKVEADYTQRLDEVVSELRSYRDDISDSLESHRSARAGLTDQETDATERLAEAELRYTVGEFDEQKWSETKTGIEESLEKIREELQNVDVEVSELEEVMGLLDGGGPHEEVEEIDEGMDLDAAEIKELESALDTELTGAVSAGPETEPDEEDFSGKTSLDELEFLRSVTEDKKHGPSPARASGEVNIPDEVLEEVELSASGSSKAIGAEDVTSYADMENRPKKAAAKTLKCGECGTINLPTEWYCERCGAELAAL